MQKNTLFKIFFFFFVYLPSFCQTKQFDTLQPIGTIYYSSQTILPAYYRELSEKLMLPLINKNTDSFSLRLWTGSMFGNELFLLRKNNEKWDSHRYQYYDTSTLKEVKFKPEISISNLMDSLKMIDFEKLISQNKIENFQDDVDDGTIYTLEILYYNSYRIFQYHSPELFANKELNNKIFLKTLKFLERYFR